MLRQSMDQRVLRVGAIKYINSLPYIAAIKARKVQSNITLVEGVPAELNRHLREGLLDVSFISTAEYLQNSDRYEMIGDYCIAASDQVLSVSLYTKGLLHSLDGKFLGVTPESTTAFQLVRVLCHHFWGISPRLLELTGRFHELAQRERYDAFLLIGDVCLRHPEFPGYHTIDLAQAWYYATGLPFTFAVLAARKDILKEKQPQIEGLKHSLDSALFWARSNRSDIVTTALKQCPVGENRMSDYFEALRYSMEEVHLKGMRLFEAMLKELPPLEPLNS